VALERHKNQECFPSVGMAVAEIIYAAAAAANKWVDKIENGLAILILIFIIRLLTTRGKTLQILRIFLTFGK
jgi:hypothetical protein